jgi:hypothetical protein
MTPTVIIIFTIFLLGAFLLLGGSTRETYGGPIKVLRRLPINECKTICDNYFYDCLRKTRLTDYDLCEKRQTACKAICTYSNFQRL